MVSPLQSLIANPAGTQGNAAQDIASLFGAFNGLRNTNNNARQLDMQEQALAQEQQAQVAAAQRAAEEREVRDGARDAVIAHSIKDPQRRQAFFQRRIESLEKQGRDSSHTRALAALPFEDQNSELVRTASVLTSMYPGGEEALLSTLGFTEGKSDRYGGNLVAALDAEGNPVYVQSDKSGGARVVDGFRPPKTASELKQEEAGREQDATAIDLGYRANLFFETLNDPDIESATGLLGAAKGAIGRKTGSKAGVLSGRLQRLGTGMVLQAAEALSGAMSDGDIKLLKANMPEGSDDVALWRDWYETEYVPTIKASATREGVDFETLGLPEGFPDEQDRVAGGAAPKVGAVEDGYRFKGGDPSDQNNWERL